MENIPDVLQRRNGLRIYIYEMEYHSAVKNEICLFASKWTELENIILSEVSQVQKDKGLMFSLLCGR
jgi:hypothetical protein